MSVVHRLEDEPAETRRDYLSSLLSSRIVPLEFHPAADVDLEVRFVTGDLGALRVSEATGPAGDCVRTPGLIRRSDPDHYTVTVVQGCGTVHEQAGRQIRLAPGDFTVVHSSHPFLHAHPEVARVVDVSFPRAMISLPLERLAELAGVGLGGHGVEGLASTLIQRLPQHLDDSGAANGARLGAIVVDLLTVAMADRLVANAVDARQRTLLPRIYAFIQERLGDPELSPATIAAAHHISLRYLHRLFESEGTTVAQWIRHSRLERCRRDLLDPALASRSIGATAARWGFTSAAHFNRAFRAAYGSSPGAYRTTFGTNVHFGLAGGEL